MSAQESRPQAPAGPPEQPAAGEERESFSYQGSKVPLFVILIWLAFFAWGVVYLVRWIPESWREWFAR
ncbi:MAG: hypothetical protein HY721_12315 [Planctomycetes bacterium]|nr:hypothetical protein [Planctomycetota bacterium]